MEEIGTDETKIDDIVRDADSKAFEISTEKTSSEKDIIITYLQGQNDLKVT